jgi:hypothetical protein
MKPSDLYLNEQNSSLKYEVYQYEFKKFNYVMFKKTKGIE